MCFVLKMKNALNILVLPTGLDIYMTYGSVPLCSCSTSFDPVVRVRKQQLLHNPVQFYINHVRFSFCCSYGAGSLLMSTRTTPLPVWGGSVGSCYLCILSIVQFSQWPGAFLQDARTLPPAKKQPL